MNKSNSVLIRCECGANHTLTLENPLAHCTHYVGAKGTPVLVVHLYKPNRAKPNKQATVEGYVKRHGSPFLAGESYARKMKGRYEPKEV